jgi:hypothetical protein
MHVASPSAPRFGTPFRDADCEAEEIMDGKLAQLIEIEGYSSLDDILTAALSDSVAPGICIREGCSYTCEVEPDQDAGWCEACGRQSVRSALVLACVI